MANCPFELTHAMEAAMWKVAQYDTTGETIFKSAKRVLEHVRSETLQDEKNDDIEQSVLLQTPPTHFPISDTIEAIIEGSTPVKQRKKEQEDKQMLVSINIAEYNRLQKLAAQAPITSPTEAPALQLPVAETSKRSTRSSAKKSKTN